MNDHFDFSGDNENTKDYDTYIQLYNEKTKREIKFKCHKNKLYNMGYFKNMFKTNIIKFYDNDAKKVVTQFRMSYKWKNIANIILNSIYGIHIDYKLFNLDIISDLYNFYIDYKYDENKYIINLLIHIHNEYIYSDNQTVKDAKKLMKNAINYTNNISRDKKILVYSNCNKYEYVIKKYYNRYIKNREEYEKINQKYYIIIYDYLVLVNDNNRFEFMLYIIDDKMKQYSNNDYDISLSALVELVDYFISIFNLYQKTTNKKEIRKLYYIIRKYCTYKYIILTISLNKSISIFTEDVLMKFDNAKLCEPSMMLFSKYILKIHSSVGANKLIIKEYNDIDTDRNDETNIMNKIDKNDETNIDVDYAIIKCLNKEYKYNVNKLIKYTYFKRCLDPNYNIKLDVNDNKLIIFEDEYVDAIDILLDIINYKEINYISISKDICILVIRLMDYINEPEMIYNFIINKMKSFEDDIYNIPISSLLYYITTINKYINDIIHDIIDETVLTKVNNESKNILILVNFISHITNNNMPDKIEIPDTHINKSIIKYVQTLFRLFKVKYASMVS